MPNINPSLVLVEAHNLDFQDRAAPSVDDLKDNEVLINPTVTGICGSDIHYLKHGRIGPFVVKAPMVLGHESSGIVLGTGKGVKDFKSGDRIALEPGETCLACEYCLCGKYELCADVKFAATPPYDGTLAQYYTLPAHLCHKIPDNMTLEEGAMIEPLSVGIHAVMNVAQMAPNKNVVIIGAGPIGLVLMASARALGARRIITIDIDKGRLDFALAHGYADAALERPTKETIASDTRFDSEAKTVNEDPKIQCLYKEASCLLDSAGLRRYGLSGVDYVFEATGVESCSQLGIFLLKPAGTFVQIGTGAENLVIPITYALIREIKILGSFRYGPGVYKTAIDLVGQRKIDVKPLITHKYPFSRAKDAFSAMIAAKGDDGKPPIKCIIYGPTYNPPE